MSLKGKNQKFKVLRGEGDDAEMEDYELELDEGMVILDCMHRIQYEQEPDLAVRWNCKAGKCGSCSAEINGRPRLMCMTRMSDVVAETPAGQPIEIRPMKTFPHTSRTSSQTFLGTMMSLRRSSQSKDLKHPTGNSTNTRHTEFSNSENVSNVSYV